MRALIFAAGRGERMRPLTDATPKPLLLAGNRTLIAWHLQKLAAAGIETVVINTSWLASQFPQALGDGSRWGLRIVYSYEGATPLDTGGGMLAALPLLGDAPFVLVNGDIWSDVDYATLPPPGGALAHLVMVDAAAHAPSGDFALDAGGVLHEHGDRMLTYAGVGVYSPRILDDWRRLLGEADDGRLAAPAFGLAALLRAHIRSGRIRATHHQGRWTDVGTPERLEALRHSLAAQS